MAKELAVVDVTFTTIQYMNKWKVLKREYQKTVEHNAQTGIDKKLCQFYDELRSFTDTKVGPDQHALCLQE